MACKCFRSWAPIGPAEEAAPHAAALGRAFQLTNFLRDIDEDLMRQRVYLPADELAAHGVDRDLLMWCHHNRRTDPRVRDALADQHDIARQVYRYAADGVAMLAPRSRPCVATALTLYSEILDRIEDCDFAVFSQRATVGTGATTARRRRRPAAFLASPAEAPGRLRRSQIRCGVMDHWQYLIVLAACLAITLPLEIFRPGVYRQLVAGRARRATRRRRFRALG